MTGFLRGFESIHDSRITIHALAVAMVMAIAGCGVETATTAATGAAIKKQEVEQGKKTMEAVQQKIDQAAQQVQQRTERNEAADKQ